MTIFSNFNAKDVEHTYNLEFLVVEKHPTENDCVVCIDK
jgi:hypothetical protein